MKYPDQPQTTTLGPLGPIQVDAVKDQSLPLSQVEANIKIIEERLEAWDSSVYGWWYNQVRNKGSMDYKQGHREFETFGNFNYGATGAALGIPLHMLLGAAGWAQRRSGTSLIKYGVPFLVSPYGDDPKDQAAIRAGYEYYIKTHKQKKT